MLVAAECANVLWKKVRRKELSADEAIFAAGLLARADIEIEPTHPLFERALKLAILLDHPAYDCTYLALVENRGCDFVTAEESLSRKTRQTSVTTNVIVLSTINLP